MPSFFLTALNFLLSVIDWRSPSSRSALALTSRSATATAQRARADFEECDGGWARAAYGRPAPLPLTSITAQSAYMATILPPERRHSRPAPFR
jgi:hypothetical protein